MAGPFGESGVLEIVTEEAHKLIREWIDKYADAVPGTPDGSYAAGGESALCELLVRVDRRVNDE